MMAVIIDGKKIADGIKEDVRKRVEALKEKGITPKLVVVHVAGDKSSDVYVKNKISACSSAGIDTELVSLDSSTTDNMIGILKKLSTDSNVHGIIVQLPMPDNIDENAVLGFIEPEKDVDCLNPVNAGKIALGIDAIEPCTPKGIVRMLDSVGVEIKGKTVAIVNRSRIVGRPLALMMLNRHATVTVCHSKTTDIAKHTREADIVIVAVGKPKFLTKDMIKAGSVVIDVGINRVDDKLAGDVDFENVKEKASYITPVPGGVGPLTVAMVLENVVTLAEKSARPNL